MKKNILTIGLLIVIAFSICTLSFTPSAAPIPNTDPIADATAGEPYLGYINQEIIFDGSNSSDPDGDIVNYTWDFGVDTSGYGIKATHIYESPGDYSITLTVTDNEGATHSTTTFATIALPNLQPTTPTIDGPDEGKTNQSIAFTVAATDPDNQSISYIFDWGDGESDETAFVPSGVNATQSHTWTKPGTYAIMISASDGEALSQVAEFSISIEQGKEPTPAGDSTWLIVLVIIIIIALVIIFIFMKPTKPKEKKQPPKKPEEKKQPPKETKKTTKKPATKKK